MQDDFDIAESERQFQVKVTLAKSRVEELLAVKGVEPSSIKWAEMTQGSLMLMIEFPRLGREGDVSIDRELIIGIADEVESVRREALAKIELILRDRV